jgi:hypothetical protein
MRFFRLMAITVLLLACVVLGSACAGAKGDTGPKGDTGADGVGVENIVNNGDGTFTVNLTNGESYITDNLTGPQGLQGAQGTPGPQGPQGEPGLPGAGVAWQGEWSNATTYSLNDGVGYQGSSYVSKQDGNTNHVPTDAAWWDLWVEKGDTGAAGAAGADGADGEDGEDGAPGPNMIVAMGVINSNGGVLQEYNVAGCTWNDTYDWYEITLTGISYFWTDWVTSITPAASVDCFAGFGSTSGKLTVHIFDSEGNPMQSVFSFMVLDATL